MATPALAPESQALLSLESYVAYQSRGLPMAVATDPRLAPFVALGSLQRRLRNCMAAVRADPYAYGAQELVELELYLAVRASGMAVETPAVRP